MKKRSSRPKSISRKSRGGVSLVSRLSKQNEKRRTRFHALSHLFLLFFLFVQLTEFSSLATPVSAETLVEEPIPASVETPEEIIEEVELTDREVQQHIQDLVQEIYSHKKSYFEGISHVKVAREDLKFLFKNNTESHAHVLGGLGHKTIYIKDSGEQTNRWVLHHEVGHNVWRHLNSSAQQEWKLIHAHEDKFASAYARSNPEEDFAESFACYFLGHNNCDQKISVKKWDFIEENV